jgi:hypothetical protein
MDKETVCTPELPGEHWKRPRPGGFGQAYESFWDFHRKTEDRLRRRICKKHPNMSYEEAEAIVAIQMLEMFENQKEKFLAHLPTASDRDHGLTESSEAAPLADGRNQQFSAFMVKWRI